MTGSMQQEKQIFNRTIFRNGSGEDISISSPPQYDPQKIIGSGSQGVVCQGWDNDNSGPVAIKQSTQAFINEQNAKSIFREFELSSVIDHRHIIKLKYAYTPQDYEDFSEIYLVYEYMDTNLLDFYNRHHNLFQGKHGGETIGYLVHQLLLAVQYLHQHELIHRDLKQQNILLKKQSSSRHFDYILKLADFGLARQLPSSGENVTQSISTLAYRAPELCMSNNYGTAVDMWSIGCLIFELITGKRLFPAKNETELLRSVVKTIPLNFEELSSLPPSIFGNAKTYDWSINLLEQKLEGCGSEWNTTYVNISNFKESLNGLLAFDPIKRLTAEEALKLPMWNYLPKCKDADKLGKMGKPYVDKYGNEGTINEWRDRLYTGVKEYQKRLEKKKTST